MTLELNYQEACALYEAVKLNTEGDLREIKMRVVTLIEEYENAQWDEETN